jgi:hypothetical protein
MEQFIPVISGITALALPWISGIIWVYLILAPTSQKNNWLIGGYGYLIGILITTASIRVWHLLGLSLDFWGIAGCVAAIGLLGAVLIAARSPVRATRQANALATPAKLLTLILAALILWRYALLAEEILLRPLFPWDAWMNWAPKSIVWFHDKELTPWVSRGEWLWAQPGSVVYTAGAGEAWKYPIIVPLLQLWTMLAMGTTEQTLAYLPWLFVAIAMGMMLYGHLRLAGASVLLSTAACYAILNLPFISVHVALAGYADIWLTAAFGGVIFAAQAWSETRSNSYAILSFLLILVCFQLKIPGIVIALIGLTVLVSCLLRFSAQQVVAIIVAATGVIAYILFIGISVNIPGVGEFIINGNLIQLPYIGSYALQYHDINQSLLITLFAMMNWHFLSYLFVAVVLIQILTGQMTTVPSVVLRGILLSLGFILFVYYFSKRAEYALDYTQINRALIYLTPLVTYYVFIRIHEWMKLSQGEAQHGATTHSAQ